MLNLPEKLSDEEINEMLRTADKVRLILSSEYTICQILMLVNFIVRMEMDLSVMKNSAQ